MILTCGTMDLPPRQKKEKDTRLRLSYIWITYTSTEPSFRILKVFFESERVELYFEKALVSGTRMPRIDYS